MHCQGLCLDNFKSDFLNIILHVCAPSDSRFLNRCISAKYCPIITNHTSMKTLLEISISQNWPLWLVLWSKVTYDKSYLTGSIPPIFTEIAGGHLQGLVHTYTFLFLTYYLRFGLPSTLEQHFCWGKLPPNWLNLKMLFSRCSVDCENGGFWKSWHLFIHDPCDTLCQ